MCCCLWVPMCRMLAYRAEDISKRLVPHELYNREELEESVQFDVSLLCGAHITNLHSLILPLPSLSLYNPSCLNLYVSSSTSLHHPSYHLPYTSFPHYVHPSYHLPYTSFSPIMTTSSLSLIPIFSTPLSPSLLPSSCKHRWQRRVF